MAVFGGGRGQTLVQQANRVDMGIGLLGDPRVIIKRKFQWTWELIGSCGGNSFNISESFVKSAGRPNISIDEIELNFLNDKMWIPGKASWSTISVTYYDIAGQFGASNGIHNLYNWLATIYDFSNPNRRMASKQGDYSCTAFLREYDGCGQNIASWQLNNVWATEINFGDLDYGSSEEMTIELTMRFNNVIYRSHCPNFTPSSCCSPCDDRTSFVVN